MKLSIDAVLEIAQKMEQNASAYYEQAAAKFPRYAKDLLLLKKMEEVHQSVFLKIQDSLNDAKRSKLSPDPFGELDGYLQAFADTSGGEGRKRELELMNGKESFAEILDHSIHLEKESIAFYRHISSFVAKEDKVDIDLIISEEENHVKSLVGIKAQIQKE